MKVCSYSVPDIETITVSMTISASIFEWREIMKALELGKMPAFKFADEIAHMILDIGGKYDYDDDDTGEMDIDGHDCGAAADRCDTPLPSVRGMVAGSGMLDGSGDIVSGGSDSCHCRSRQSDEKG